MTAPPPWFDAGHTHAAAGVFLLMADGRLILQLRDDIPDIDNPGMITTFGGAAERHEQPLECALRELAEETALAPAAQDLRMVDWISRVDWRGNNTACVFFLLTNVDPRGLQVSEGTAITLTMAEIATDPRVTPACRAMAVKIPAILASHDNGAPSL